MHMHDTANYHWSQPLSTPSSWSLISWKYTERVGNRQRALQALYVLVNFQFSVDTIDTDAATSTTTATTTDANVTWMCPICGLNVDNMDEHFETHV